MPDEPRGEPGAIIRPDLAEPILELTRSAPRESLRPFVEYLWVVQWTITGTPHRQQVLPQPKIHMAAEDGRLFVSGISREPFYRTLTATSHTVGIAFRPAGFRPLLRSSVGALEGQRVPARELWPYDDAPVAERVLAEADPAVMAETVQDYLDLIAPEPDPFAEELGALVERIESDTGIHRVEQVAELAAVSTRTLQRQFLEYVGIGPKWVIQRRRLLDAAEQAHSGTAVDWADLAVQLGFSDQAHLIRAFTAAVGTPPATYVRETKGWHPRG